MERLTGIKNVRYVGDCVKSVNLRKGCFIRSGSPSDVTDEVCALSYLDCYQHLILLSSVVRQPECKSKSLCFSRMFACSWMKCTWERLLIYAVTVSWNSLGTIVGNWSIMHVRWYMVIYPDAAIVSSSQSCVRVYSNMHTHWNRGTIVNFHSSQLLFILSMLRNLSEGSDRWSWHERFYSWYSFKPKKSMARISNIFYIQSMYSNPGYTNNMLGLLCTHSFYTPLESDSIHLST